MKIQSIILLGTIFLCSCSKLTNGVVVDKKYEEANKSTAAIFTGKIVVPVVIYDDEDYIIMVKGEKPNGKEVVKHYYTSNHLYDSLTIGDNICLTEECRKKDD